MKRRFLAILALTLGACLSFTACVPQTSDSGASDSGSSGSTSDSGASESDASGSTSGSADDAEDNNQTITDEFFATGDLSQSQEKNEKGENETVYTVTKGGEYDFKGALSGRIVVNAPGEQVILNLTGAAINSTVNSPIFVADADSVEISAKKDTYNEINDGRKLRSQEDETQGGGAIYAKCDLKMKGNGSLVVRANYNNGIHTTKDLVVKNETLKVTAPNNALKGNDSFTMESGNVIAISTAGDGIKTEHSDLSSKGKQRGTVSVLAGSLDVYSAQDGIDASYNVELSGGEVNILTDKYSEFTEESTVSDGKIYLRTTNSSSAYRYAVYFYDDEGNYQWVDAEYSGSATASSGNGNAFDPGMGGPGGRDRTYYYYSLIKPEGYTGMRVYRFNSSQANSTTSYNAVSAGGKVNAQMNQYSLTISGTKITGDWGMYTPGKDAASSKGIKADNAVTITDGTLAVTALDDAIHVNNDIVLETGTKGSGKATVSGGTLTLLTGDDAIHAEGGIRISGGMIEIKDSHEGLEGSNISIEGGRIYVYATDDGVNASGGNQNVVSVSGGYLDVTMPTGDVDGIDSNGDYIQTGGFVISRDGTMLGGGVASGLDVDGTCTITGGTFICAGAIGETPSDSSQNRVIFGTIPQSGSGGFGRPGGVGASSSSVRFTAGEYKLSGTDITFNLAQEYTGMWICSDQLNIGSSYTLTNGTTSKSWTQSSASVSVNS